MMGGKHSEVIKSPHESPHQKKNKKKIEIIFRDLKCPHPETNSDNDSDWTLFPKFIVLESTKDTLSPSYPFHY